MSDQKLHARGHTHSASYNSAESGVGQPYLDPQTGGSINLSSVSPPPSPTSKSPRSLSQPYDASSRSEFVGGRFSARSIGRAVASRAVRAARRGNLPFLVVFLSCLVIFFSALAGIGYVDPETQPDAAGSHAGVAKAPAARFVPGVPVFDADENSEVARRRQHEQRKELEKEWQKMKRPKDGAWMRKQRDDKAIRRVAVKDPAPARVEKYDPTEKDGEVERRGLVIEERPIGIMDIQDAPDVDTVVESADEAYNEGRTEALTDAGETSAVSGASADEDGDQEEPVAEQIGVGADQLEQESEELAAQQEIEENARREASD